MCLKMCMYSICVVGGKNRFKQENGVDVFMGKRGV